VPGEEGRRDKGEPFRLPADEGGALLGRVLAPVRPAVPENFGPQRRTLPPPRDFAARMPPLPAGEPTAVRLPTSKPTHLLRPHLVHDEGLGDHGTDPVVPVPVSFAAEARIKIMGEDEGIPPPLPILAQPTIDRVSFEDPTIPASTAAALAAPLPDRTSPAPYQKTTIPEPYENRRPLTISPPAEGDSPQAGTPQAGKP
jgi:hypothetical protein